MGGRCAMPTMAMSESTKRTGRSRVMARRSRHAATARATERAEPRRLRTSLMRRHASSGSRAPRWRMRSCSHSSRAHCQRPTASRRVCRRSATSSRWATSEAAYSSWLGSSGRRSQSVRRSALGSLQPELALVQRGQRRGGHADEPGGDLRVEQARAGWCRRRSRGPRGPGPTRGGPRGRDRRGSRRTGRGRPRAGRP